MLACREGHQSVAMILLEKGANRQLLNKVSKYILLLIMKKSINQFINLDHINRNITNLIKINAIVIFVEVLMDP